MEFWLKTPGCNLLLVALIAIVFLFILQPLFAALQIPAPSENRFAYLAGDPLALVLTLALVAWGTAAFGEEILAQGFVLGRLCDVFGKRRSGILMALLVHAVLFGVAHFSAGPRGIITAAVVAVMLGGAFLVSGRNLWSVIPAHGIVDTISLVQVYQGGSG